MNYKVSASTSTTSPGIGETFIRGHRWEAVAWTGLILTTTKALFHASKIQELRIQGRVITSSSYNSCQFFYVLLQAIKTTCETRGTIGSLLEDINLHIHIVMFLIEHQ